MVLYHYNAKGIILVLLVLQPVLGRGGESMFSFNQKYDVFDQMSYNFKLILSLVMWSEFL